MDSDSLESIVDQTIAEYTKSIDQYSVVLSSIMEITWIPKQILINLSSCLNYIQNKDIQSSLDALEEISTIIQSLNSKINLSIQQLKDGVVSAGI